MIKIANPWGSRERERERERVLLKNRCFAKSILFVVPEKEVVNKAQVKSAKEIENKKENIERTRMDYSIDMLKKIFMRI